MRNKIKFFRQYDNMDCGPTCLRMIASYHGKEYEIDFLRNISGITKKGVTLLGLQNAAKEIGLDAAGIRASLEQIDAGIIQLPCIIHWNEKHFTVLFKVKRTFINKILGKSNNQYIVGDPSHGIVKLDRETFTSSWMGEKKQGVALLLDITPEFFTKKRESYHKSASTLTTALNYLKPYYKYIALICVGMLFSSMLLLLLPFLTQNLVDFGIANKSTSFISLVILSQIIIFIGNSLIDMVRNQILIHINIRVSVTIIASFLDKLMKLPISFFESKNIGDITQRINDHSRVESFLTGTLLSAVFSVINLLVFSSVLIFYNTKIFFIFSIIAAFSVCWVSYFLSKRKDLNYLKFLHSKDNQTAIYEIVDGIKEIKLNNWEFGKRKNWENIQFKLFDVTSKMLVLEQTQELGYNLLLQVKNAVISYMTVMLVISNKMTLGQMISISFIIGQMNAPLNQLILFMRSVQDAKISFERLAEIQQLPDESNHHSTPNAYFEDDVRTGIVLKDVYFKYAFQNNISILNGINLFIPEGKTTAIIGPSGSGKTTLLKLLLRFYDPTAGTITVNEKNLSSYTPSQWRNLCGTVMQDGYIFSDTILRNIIVEADTSRIDTDRLQHALQISNLSDYVNKLPLGLLSYIGNTGMGLSGGQRQRVLIARAAYNNPKYLFLDEATSSLDANNEKVVMNNFNSLFEGKTVIVIAHRLSTIKNADQIVVMEEGRVGEIGTHDVLISKRGKYYELIKNQLDSELVIN